MSRRAYRRCAGGPVDRKPGWKRAEGPSSTPAFLFPESHTQALHVTVTSAGWGEASGSHTIPGQGLDGAHHPVACPHNLAAPSMAGHGGGTARRCGLSRHLVRHDARLLGRGTHLATAVQQRPADTLHADARRAPSSRIARALGSLARALRVSRLDSGRRPAGLSAAEEGPAPRLRRIPAGGVFILHRLDPGRNAHRSSGAGGAAGHRAHRRGVPGEQRDANRLRGQVSQVDLRSLHPLRLDLLGTAADPCSRASLSRRRQNTAPFDRRGGDARRAGLLLRPVVRRLVRRAGLPRLPVHAHEAPVRPQGTDRGGARNGRGRGCGPGSLGPAQQHRSRQAASRHPQVDRYLAGTHQGSHRRRAMADHAAPHPDVRDAGARRRPDLHPAQSQPGTARLAGMRDHRRGRRIFLRAVTDGDRDRQESGSLPVAHPDPAVHLAADVRVAVAHSSHAAPPQGPGGAPPAGVHPARAPRPRRHPPHPVAGDRVEGAAGARIE